MHIVEPSAGLYLSAAGQTTHASSLTGYTLGDNALLIDDDVSTEIGSAGGSSANKEGFALDFGQSVCVVAFLMWHNNGDDEITSGDVYIAVSDDNSNWTVAGELLTVGSGIEPAGGKKFWITPTIVRHSTHARYWRIWVQASLRIGAPNACQITELNAYHFEDEFDFNSDSHIVAAETTTFTSVSNISGAFQVASNSSIFKTDTQTFDSDAVVTIDFNNFNSNTHITASETGNFYSSTVIDGAPIEDRFFTTVATTRPAIIISATSNESTAKSALLNDNLNTSWSGSAGTQDIVVDTVQAHSIDTFGFWIQSYDSDYSNDTVTLYGSDNGVDWNGGYVTSITNIQGNGLFYVWMNLEYNYRYFKFSFNLTGSPVLKISKLLLMEKHSIAREYNSNGSSITPRWFNDKVKLSGAREQVPMLHRDKVTNYKLTYDLTNTSMIDEIQSIFNESRGRLLYFIYQPDITIVGSRLCRFNSDKPKWQPIHNSLWRTTLEFTTISYILDGENT